MKRIFFATAILATSFSYGMEQEMSVKRSPRGMEDQTVLKKSPRLPLSDQVTSRTSKSHISVTRTRALSEESPRFIKEENISRLIAEQQAKK